MITSKTLPKFKA
jgi:hypothetical protein